MRYSRTIPFLFSILILISVDSQAQTTRRVPADHPTIQQAINASVNGDTVLVAPGIYVENINFIGKAITVRSEQGSGVTIIDGNRISPVVTFISGEGQSSIIDGFTIRNGIGGFFPFGGGIDIFQASPTILNNVITNNQASFQGGGIAVVSGSPTIRNNSITNNVSFNEGGGIGAAFSPALIEGNTISNNQSFMGGGITVRGGDTTRLLNNTVSNNTASFAGGGISLWSAGPMLIRGNTIKGNSADSQGGGIWAVNFSPSNVIQNLIVDNSAFDGGGIYWANPLGTVINNTIAGNDSNKASGLSANGFVGSPKVINNIIVAKTGQTAIFCDFLGFPPPQTGFQFNNVYSPQGAAWSGDCPDLTGVDGNISANPLFVDPANGNYHLQQTSPSIDVGENTAVNLPETDFDGDTRILDGNGDGIATVDMGIDEVSPQGSAFDICIQSGDGVLRIDSETGDYQFTDCNAVTLTGTGTLRNKGCTITLQHNASDRRIQAMVNICQNRGTATVQVLSPRRTYNLTDPNITDGCGCN